MFLGNTASEIFIPRHFLFALPLSKVCAMRSALCLSRLCRCSRLRRPALSLSLCGVVCKFVKSFLFVVLTLPHQRPFFPKLIRRPRKKINWQFEHLVLAARFEWDRHADKTKVNKRSTWTTDQNLIRNRNRNRCNCTQAVSSISISITLTCIDRLGLALIKTAKKARVSWCWPANPTLSVLRR